MTKQITTVLTVPDSTQGRQAFIAAANAFGHGLKPLSTEMNEVAQEVNDNAVAAENSRVAAVTAKNAAETAQGNAENARAGAEQSASVAQVAATAAAAAASGISPVGGPSSITLSRNPDGTLSSVTEVLDGLDFVTALNRTNGVLTQVVKTYDGATRTETLNRNPDGSLASVTIS